MKICVFEMAALAMVFNDAETLENLQNKLIELNTAGNSIQARADAEKRDLTADEQKEMSEIFASFAAVEADIERRKQLEELNAKVSAPTGRKSNPEVQDNQEQPRKPYRPEPQLRDHKDANKWGFRSQAEYLGAVVASSRKGGQIDPRLIANASPSTYGTEGSGADGGFGVPPDFRNVIISKVMGEDSLISMTDQLSTSSNNITFPADETTPWQTTGGIQAYWESEAGVHTQSKPALVEKTIKANKIIALVPLTDELLDDAPAMASYVNRKAPEKINFKLNDAIINGSGAGMPLGILTSAGTVVVTKESSQTADTVNFNNIVKLYSALTPAARSKGKWLMNPDVEQQLMTMQFPGTGTAVPAYLPPGGLSASPYGTLLGRPVIPTEACPALGDKGDIIFGDLGNYQTVIKAGGIRSDVSIHIWFDYDITAFRFVLRVGGQPLWNSSITAFQSGSSARGFFATLEARP
jgi:HK97 family phage major capsid protein